MFFFPVPKSFWMENDMRYTYAAVKVEHCLANQIDAHKHYNTIIWSQSDFLKWSFSCLFSFVFELKILTVSRYLTENWILIWISKGIRIKFSSFAFIYSCIFSTKKRKMHLYLRFHEHSIITGVELSICGFHYITELLFHFFF